MLRSRFATRLVAPDGQIVPVGEIQVEIDPAAPAPTRLQRAQPPQPTADELIALNPALPVAERHGSYVIFDLRGLYRDR